MFENMPINETPISNFSKLESIKNKFKFKFNFNLNLPFFKKKSKSNKEEETLKVEKTKKLKVWHKVVIALSIFLLVVVSALAVMGYYSYQVAMEIKNQAYQAKAQAQIAYDTFKAQNLVEAQNQLGQIDNQLNTIKTTYHKLSFYKYIPVANKYYQDGEQALLAGEHGLNAANKAMEAIVPYADVLGFQGEGSFTGGTAENRIKILLETLDKVSPVFDEIITELESANQALAQIDSKRYPEKVKTYEVRAKLDQVKDLSNQAITMLVEFKPVLEELPNIAGGKGERKKYLILFQNDNELRPTGGFLTAYAVVYIEDGKITPEKSDDIYELDLKFKKTEKIPDALAVGLTTEKKWNLRDMNIWPDFRQSMDKFFTNYQNIPGEPDSIDGIISVDTHVLTGLLNILGPVQIAGGGTFSAETDPRCDCPQVVYALSEIITKPTPYLREDRKGILGPLMQSVLMKAYGAPKQQFPALFQLAWQLIEGRNIQMYFKDEKAQQAAETVNAAGRMTLPENRDFLGIVNTNLGGAKSNLFTTYTVKQLITDAPANGKLSKTVEVTYKNSRKGDNCDLEAGKLCLNASMLDWTRLYVPKGAELISAQGFSGETKVYEENGFSVIEGYFTLEPLSLAKISVTYTIPYQDQDNYKVTLWKQGGVDAFETLFDVTGGQEKVMVDKDTNYEVVF